ncbi:hypothetical protein Tco_1272516 [Tanacetum coccineum]
MTSFDYRLNPDFYAIKNARSCGVVYTADFCCSKKGLEDKILVPKPPRNCARCARCGTPVDGPYCQGCALLRKKFKEDLFTYYVENEFFEDLQDNSRIIRLTLTTLLMRSQEPLVGNRTRYTDEGKKENANRRRTSGEVNYLEDSIVRCDEDNFIAFTPVFPSEEPVTLLSMGDKHLDTIPETE